MATLQMSEPELLAALQRGDAHAQRCVYDLHARKLYPVCLRYMGSEAAAQDCLQDAFIRIFERIDEFKGDGPLGAWMRTVVVTVCLHALRKRRMVEVELGPEAEEYSDEENDALSALAAADLMKLIRSLPDGYREVLNLYAIEGYPHQEVAAMLGISHATSRVRLNRARLMLQNSIERMKLKP